MNKIEKEKEILREAEAKVYHYKQLVLIYEEWVKRAKEKIKELKNDKT